MNQVAAERARQAYQSSQVELDDPIGLIVRLYDGMLGFLGRAAEALEAGRVGDAAEPIRRAADIVGELQAVLNLEAGGEIAANLDRIYAYCRRRLMESHLERTADGLREVIRLLTPLRDAWTEAREKELKRAAAS